MYHVTTTLYVTSYAPYKTSHPLFMTSHHCSHHIASTAFMISHTLYMTSHTWQHKRYICHLTHNMWHYIHFISVIKPSVSIIPHPISGWHHTHYMYHIIFNMHGLTWTLSDISPLYVWYHTHYIYDIISNIYDTTHTAFMTTQRLYLRFHPQYLTSQPLYQCHHICCIDDITTSMEVITLGIRITWYTFYMKSHWQFMISMLSIYDITTTIFDMVCMLSLSSHPLYWWYHTNCIYEISSAIYDDIISIVYNIFTTFVTSQPLYLCLTPSLSMISQPLYVWHYTHYMFHVIYTL